MLGPATILLCIAVYFCFLLLIAWYTGRRATDSAYFIGNKSSPWLVVAIGLISDSLSGVTFISVPGQVGTAQFAYFQVVLGYVVGYVVIAQVLLPLYYRRNLTSIYSYLGERLGPRSQKVGSAFFLLSRLVGAGARLYLAAAVLQAFVFKTWNVPFSLTVVIIIGLMLVYTYRGGIRTLVWTDLFQSSFLIGGVVISVVLLVLELNKTGRVQWMHPDLTQVFFWDWHGKDYFWKQFVSGAFIAIAMTGLDQNSMQKNLSCRSLQAAQKNIYSFTVMMLVINFLFLQVGSLLYQYTRQSGIEVPARTDLLFPTVALQHLNGLAALAFVLGITAATFSSADSVLTTLTTSFCIDFAGIDRPGFPEARKRRVRHLAHLGFAVLLLGVILLFDLVNRESVIQAVLTLAGYTYGPLLGLFAFGLFTRQPAWDAAVPWVCVASPILTWLIGEYGPGLLGGYQFSFELLIMNGLITFFGIWFLKPSPSRASVPGI